MFEFVAKLNHSELEHFFLFGGSWDLGFAGDIFGNIGQVFEDRKAILLCFRIDWFSFFAMFK